MRAIIGLSMILLSLAGAAPAACPEFPGPRLPGQGGPSAFTVLRRMKKIPPPRVHLPVPEGPIDGVRIRMRRSGCYGDCPAYSIEIKGNGQAHYSGHAFTLVGGDHDFSIPSETVGCLLKDFRSVDFWSLAPAYRAPVTDLATTEVTLEIGGRTKSLEDYAGTWVGMPPSVVDLEDAVDLASARRWVSGDATTVPTLRAEGFDFHSFAGGQILANAAVLDNPEVAFALLAAGAPATGNSFNRWRTRTTTVEAAAEHGRSDLVGALMAAGALAGREAGLKELTLRAASRAADLATVAEVLKVQPDLNARDATGTTVLFEVGGTTGDPPADLPQRKAAVIRALLAAGADPRLRDATDTTALFGTDSADAVRALLAAGAELERRNGNGDTPLTSAASEDAALALIEAGADIAATDDSGDGLFAKATEQKWPRVLAYLSARGQSSSPQKGVSTPWPPDLATLTRQKFDFHSRPAALMLIRAANEGRDQLVLDLLAAGAPPNKVSADLAFMDAPSAIIAASGKGQLGLVRALIAAGAFTDSPYHAKEAALLAAVKAPHPEVVAELLKTGPDVNAITSDEGWTPLTAVGRATPDRIEDEPRWRAASAATTKMLLAAKADPRMANGRGDTPLHRAWSAEAIDLLVKAGANLEARNNDGETPLLATLDDDVAMALIQAGADITATDAQGNTVLGNARRATLKRTVAYLQAHGMKR